jgi:hypothetical protein
MGPRRRPLSADAWSATANILNRHTGYDANITWTFLEACTAACKRYGDECARHDDVHEHCRVWADVCPDLRTGLLRPAVEPRLNLEPIRR